MKSKALTTSVLPALLLSLIVLAGCLGGGNAVLPPGNPQDNTHASDPILDLSGWDQKSFDVPYSGGTFAFLGGRIQIPPGAVAFPREFSVAKSRAVDGLYIFQPEAYQFNKGVTIVFDAPGIHTGEEALLAVYKYREASPGQLNSFEGFVSEQVGDVTVSDGRFSLETEGFGTFAFIVHPNDYSHIAFTIPAAHLPYGAVAVRSTRGLMAPGQMAMVDLGGHLVGPSPYVDGLTEWASSVQFAGTSTGMCAYLPPGYQGNVEPGYNQGMAAAKQFQYRIGKYAASGPVPLSNRLLTPEHMSISGNLIFDSYRATEMPLDKWAKEPMGWMEKGEQVNKAYMNTADSGFDIYVSYVYCDPEKKLWLSLKPVAESPDNFFVTTYEETDKLRVHVTPTNAQPGQYVMRFGGTNEDGTDYRSDSLTFVVSNDTDTKFIDMSVPRRASGSEYVFAFLPSVELGGKGRTQLTYSNFSLDIDGKSRGDFNVYTGPKNAVWPLMDVVFVLDLTYSMDDNLDNLKSQLPGFAATLVAQGINLRLGGVGYLPWTMSEWDLTGNTDKFILDMQGIQVSNGGNYYARDTLDAVAAAVNDMSWRADAIKQIIVYSDGPMSLPGDGYGMAEHSYDSVVNLLHDKGVTLNSFYYYTHYAPDIIDLAAATGGQWLNIYYEGLNDLDLITATYALWWNDADPWVDNSHFLLLSIYNSPEDKANNNPWRNIYGWFEF